MNAHTREVDRFALGRAMACGDNVLLLDQGRHGPAFDARPGRYGLIAAFASPDVSAHLHALQAMEDARRFVDNGKAAFFAAVPGPESAELAQRFPSVRFLENARDWAQAFGVGQDGHWVIVGPTQRIVDVAPLSKRDWAFDLLERLPAPREAFGPSPPVPVLLLPGVLEPDLCRHLMEVFDRDGGRPTGFMQDDGEKSMERFDDDWKCRRDIMLSDPRLVAGVRARIGRRVCPEIKRAFQFIVSRTERDLIACYDAEAGGHFGPHRDDVGVSVAHRRFALSIPLNDDFDGGELSFPEYGPQGYKAAPGTAIVFSASLLHGVSPVARGRRYVFLSFLFDEQAEKLRRENLNSPSDFHLRLPPSAVSARWGI